MTGAQGIFLRVALPEWSRNLSAESEQALNVELVLALALRLAGPGISPYLYFRSSCVHQLTDLSIFIAATKPHVISFHSRHFVTSAFGGVYRGSAAAIYRIVQVWASASEWNAKPRIPL